jgi:hypothetical protein
VVSEAEPFVFLKAQPALRITNASADLTKNVGNTVTLVATGGAVGGSRVLTYSTETAGCSITDDQLTASGPAGVACSVIAKRSGDEEYADVFSTAVVFRFLAAQEPLFITNSTMTNPVGTRVTLITSGGSGTGAITYRLNTPNNQCSISRNVLSARSGTTCLVEAVRASSGLFQSVVSLVVSFVFTS